MIAISEEIAMAFFKRELGPIERFENALKEKLAARQKLADRLSFTEAELAEKRTAAEQLAVAGAAASRLDRAEASMRVVEDRAKSLRAALAEFDEQVGSAERALTDAKAQRDRDAVADEIEAMAAAIERAAPGFGAGAAALIDRQLIYTLHPLRWKEGTEVRRVPAFALVGLPKALLPAALAHQHVDHLNARRVQTLMHLHGSNGLQGELPADDPQIIDLDALIAEETPSAQADVA
jgi:hypothetical protein